MMVFIEACVEISLEDRGDHWAAHLKGLDATAYGDDKQGALASAEAMIDLVLESFDDLPDPAESARQYFTSHGVKCTITFEGTPSDDEDDAPSEQVSARRELVHA